MGPFRGAGILALVAMMLGPTSLIPVQFYPATAMWRVRATNHFDIYYAHARDLDSIAREAERAYARVSQICGGRYLPKCRLSCCRPGATCHRRRKKLRRSCARAVHRIATICCCLSNRAMIERKC